MVCTRGAAGGATETGAETESASQTHRVSVSVTHRPRGLAREKTSERERERGRRGGGRAERHADLAAAGRKSSSSQVVPVHGLWHAHTPSLVHWPLPPHCASSGAAGSVEQKLVGGTATASSGASPCSSSISRRCGAQCSAAMPGINASSTLSSAGRLGRMLAAPRPARRQSTRAPPRALARAG